MRCSFPCLHNCHFLFLTTPRMLDSTTFFKNVKCFPVSRVLDQMFPFHKVLIPILQALYFLSHTPATTPPPQTHSNIHTLTLDLFQIFSRAYVKYHRSCISTIYHPNTLTFVFIEFVIMHDFLPMHFIYLFNL